MKARLCVTDETNDVISRTHGNRWSPVFGSNNESEKSQNNLEKTLRRVVSAPPIHFFSYGLTLDKENQRTFPVLNKFIASFKTCKFGLQWFGTIFSFFNRIRLQKTDS